MSEKAATAQPSVTTTSDPKVTGTTLITGATGEIGSALVGRLATTDHQFRVLCRTRDQIDKFNSRGITAVLGDLNDAASLTEAMMGCSQLFLLSPATPETRGADYEAIDLARGAGIEHVVKVTTADASPESPIFWAVDHARSDERLRASGLRWTGLAAAAFMSNLLYTARATRRGFLPGSSGHGATAWVDADDIADAAFRVLLHRHRQGDSGSNGRRYLLTGTQPLSFPQVAELMTNTYGRRVRYVHVPGPLMYLGLRVRGTDRPTARSLVAQFADIVRHGRDNVRIWTPELDELLERPAISMAAFLERHRGVLS